MAVIQTDVTKALDYLTTPVAMISVAIGAKRNALTATRVSCIAAQPTLMAVAIGQDRYSHDLIKEAGEFVINLAREDQSDLAAKIGRSSGRAIDKFAEYNIATMPATKVRSPMIDGSACNMECKLVKTVEAGNFTLFIGEVIALHVDEEAAPLARFRKKNRKLGDQI